MAIDRGELKSPWWEKGTNADLLAQTIRQGTAATGLLGSDDIGDLVGVSGPWLTIPAQRPIVYQRGLNFNFPVTTVAQQLQVNRFDVDSFVVDVPSTALTSVFVGWAGVSTTSGIECRPGIPIEIASDNTREYWELQRSLEVIAALLAQQAGMPPLAPYRAPRVAINLEDMFIIGTVAQTIAIMTFAIPEQQ